MVTTKRPRGTILEKSYPESLQNPTTKQKIYDYILSHSGCLQRNISRAVGVLDAKEILNDMENKLIIYHIKSDCCGAKRWYVK